MLGIVFGLALGSCAPSKGPGESGVALGSAAVAVSPAGGGGSGMSELERGVLARINAYRAERGRAPLKRHTGLQVLAEGHAEEMMARRKLSHDGFERRAQAGSERLGLDWMAENVVWGTGGSQGELADRIVQSWIDSRGHRKNLLRDNEYTGVAVARGADGSYWAAQLSARPQPVEADGGNPTLPPGNLANWQLNYDW